MLSFFLEFRKNAEIKNPRDAKTEKGNSMLLSNNAMCDSKKIKFIKEMLVEY